MIVAAQVPATLLLLTLISGALATAASAQARCQWEISAGGADSYVPAGTGPQLDLLRFGNFDGDNKTDVFFIERGSGQWKFAPGGGSEVRNLGSGKDLFELGFGDFNGDGTTDVLTVEPESLGRSRISYSPGATGEFIELSVVSDRLVDEVNDLRFGDFNGDGTTDLLTWNGDHPNLQYSVSDGGVGPFEPFGTGRVPLILADFDADAHTDIFVIGRDLGGGQGEWLLMPASTKTWKVLRAGPGTRPGFGDFDGDRRTDIFMTVPENGLHRWQYYPEGWRDPENLAIELPLFEGGFMRLGFGDFDGDGKTDVFHPRCS